MAAQVGNTLPAAEDLATVLQEILGLSHRADPTQRKLLHDQACVFIQSIKPFRFLDLSRELRDVIYTYALVTDDPLLVSEACEHIDWPTGVQPALTRVNRQVRMESLPIFYGDNTFEAHVVSLDFGYLLSYMHGLGPQNVSYMRNMKLTSIMSAWFPKMGCAVGAFDFVRWSATAQGVTGLNMRRGPLLEGDQLTLDIVSLALESREKGETSEARLRAAFGEWMDERNMTCRCESSAGGWNDDIRKCSKNKSFDGEPVRYCALSFTSD
ncbi:hypothetical protein LTR22_013149 [Elasticomyces elasticus]|nr:hypothetical protein LTR22_013149 [Elasticomyces elasticus]KAK4928736.1 hypothetical protein LTR49_004545 [Elasticomyces elasticus]KAK5766637.1 hypothetical protein LTS12_003256 [Elasticomyces elasticus]